jgi:hypothetical protein
VCGLLYGGDAAEDGRALADNGHVVEDDVGRDDAGEGVTLLGRGAIEGLGDADGKDGIGRDRNVMKGWSW